MIKYLIDALQIFLLISTFIFYFEKYKESKLNQSLDIVKEKIEIETLEYIYYCSSSLDLVEKFVDNLVNLNHYHWCTWEDRIKGTVISLNYQICGDDWLDLYPGNYLVFNQTHKTFSYLTPAELTVEIDKDTTKDYKQWAMF